MKVNIVCFNMSKYSDWSDTGVVNRNYHILHALAKDERVNKIIAVDFLPFTWKKAIKTFLIDQLKKDRRGELVYGDLTTQVWQITSKIHIFSTIDSMVHKKRIIIELQRVIRELDMQKNLVVMNFNPMYAGYLNKALHQQVDVFDAVDNWKEHSQYTQYRSRLDKNYKKIGEQSDLIYTVSQDLQSLFPSEKAQWLPNAVDIDHFTTTEVIDELSYRPRPILGFLGIIQDRLDVDLLHKIAQKYKQGTLVLAGPVWSEFPREEFKQYDNVVFSGPVSYRNIPKFYNTFDVGLIPYRQTNFIKSTNSMKYYEYLASGLPVVATWSGGIEDFKDVIFISHDHRDFLDNIDKALLERGAEKEAIRRDFVKDMTWKARANRILEDIERKL